MESQHSQFKKEINILLLGEKRVGKSTFINVFANYLTYLNLSEALNDELINLIPSQFIITGEDFQDTTISVGLSRNDEEELINGSIHNPKSYIFSLEDTCIRLINTPGIGDACEQQTEQNDFNFEKLLTYLGQFREINAICILLKPNKKKMSTVFENYFEKLLCRLGKSASQNIMFLLTHTRTTFYRPGDTILQLRKFVEKVQSKLPHVKIPLEKENVYCIDNESFRFLAAGKQGMKFSDREKDDFAFSWKISSDEFWRLLTYIAQLGPHKIEDTISLNESRRLLIQLSQPLLWLVDQIQSNAEQFEHHQTLVTLHANEVEKLKKVLCVPVVNVRAEALEKPRTVCTNLKCCEVYQVNGYQTYHYKQVCCDPCYLKETPKEIVGCPELINCVVMDSQRNCKLCGCSYLQHMNIYYQTFINEDNVVDGNVQSQIETKDNARRAAENLSKEAEERCREYENERDILISCMAKSAQFSQNNAITAYNDAFQVYLEYLIERVESSHKKEIDNLQSTLQLYLEAKKALDKTFVTIEDVRNGVNLMCNLPHCGPKIKDIFDKQNRPEFDEYCFPSEVIFKQTRTNFRILELKKYFRCKIAFLAIQNKF